MKTLIQIINEISGTGYLIEPDGKVSNIPDDRTHAMYLYKQLKMQPDKNLNGDQVIRAALAKGYVRARQVGSHFFNNTFCNQSVYWGPKFIDSKLVNGWEIETDTGWHDVTHIHKTAEIS